MATSSSRVTRGGLAAEDTLLRLVDYFEAITTTTVGADTGIDVNVIGGSITASFGADFDFGASATALRTAAQIGNTSGAAAFGAGTTSAQTLRVVLPTDQSVIPVSDNGGSITVDGTLAVTQSTSPWVVSAASLPLPTGAATLAEQQTQTTALQLIDNLVLTQNQSTAGQSGILMQAAVTKSEPTYTDGRTNPLSMREDGNLRVYDEDLYIQAVLDSGILSSLDAQLFNISGYTSNLNTMTTAFVLNDAFATGRGVPAMAEFDDSSTSIPSGDDRVFMLRITQNRGLHSYLVNAAGTAIHVAQGSTTSGQYGALAIGAVTTAAPSYTTAQSSPLSLTTLGALRTSPTGTLGNPNFYAAVGPFDIPANFEVDPIAGTVAGVSLASGRFVGGCIAHDAADSALDLPLKVGGFSTALTSEQAAVSAAGDRVHAYFDTKGYQHTKNNPHRSAITKIFNAQVFNNTTTTANSTSFDATRYRFVKFYYSITVANAPTDIRLIVEYDRGSGNWHSELVQHVTDLRYVTAQMPVNEVTTIPFVAGATFRIRVVATGTTASATYTLSMWAEGIT